MKKQILTAILALSLVMQGSSLVWAAEDVTTVDADGAGTSAAEVMQPELEAFGSGEEAEEVVFGDGTYGIVQESETSAEDSIFTENACVEEYSEEDFVVEEAEDAELLETSVSVKLDIAHFPDATFRKYLERFDTDTNKTLSAAECSKIKKIDVKDVRNLAGIQYFPNLTDLKVSTVNGPMKKFDLTKNVKLEKLDIFCFGLTSLNVTKNVKLKELRCPLFGLKKLDVTHNPELTVLDLELNELTSLDVSNNTKLKDLNCSSNYIKKLNVTKNPNLVSLACSNNDLKTLDLRNNKKLTILKCLGNYLQPSTVKKAGTIGKVEFFPQDIVIAPGNTTSGVKLNWGKIENAVRYEIRSMNDTYKLGNVTSYTDKKAGTRNPQYDFYSLEAFSASGEQLAFGTCQTVFIKTPSLSAPAAKGGGKVALKWSKPEKATGYQIQYSTSGKFTNAKTVKVTSKNTVTKILTGLSKQKYYFRVRTYYKATDIGSYNGTYYSGWSSVKSVTVK